ncbi:hypothetical protein [Flavobacterium sp. NKUCC04_CG]|uniref:hypothetical protein n=1 Tax=Flavobacterium sp. NKUCC04_CG TaxID=2842121 RepID=UPI001C5BA605|nr:hypothetical protein [Flavobacterium sp. NKUCC04_CG]MBW3518279.1 hypothetical protein [Flavobacterium sp. NKUCC04_CG]
MKIFLQFLVCVMLFAGCKIFDDNLPEPTQKGNGTMGFYLNGERFRPSNLRSEGDGLGYSRSFGLDIMVWQYKKSFASDVSVALNIGEYPIEAGRTYRLGAFSDSFGAYGSLSYYVDTNKPGVQKEKVYYTSLEHFGELTITKHDPELRIISGLFWFNVWTDEKALVKIRGGRFDMKYIKK